MGLLPTIKLDTLAQPLSIAKICPEKSRTDRQRAKLLYPSAPGLDSIWNTLSRPVSSIRVPARTVPIFLIPRSGRKFCGPMRPEVAVKSEQQKPIGRASVDNLNAPQEVGKFFLISGVVRLPFEALFRRERLVFAGLGVEPVIEVLEHFGDRGRFQEFAHAWNRRHTGVETLGARLKEGKARSPGRVLPRFDLRFEVRSHVQEFVDALADVIGIAPDGVELNDQNVFGWKAVEIWPEVPREAS